MTNKDELYKMIKDKGYKLSSIASKLGITYACFLNKASNRSEFKSSEIEKLKNILDLSSSERDTIFFAKTGE